MPHIAPEVYVKPRHAKQQTEKYSRGGLSNIMEENGMESVYRINGRCNIGAGRFRTVWNPPCLCTLACQRDGRNSQTTAHPIQIQSLERMDGMERREQTKQNIIWRKCGSTWKNYQPNNNGRVKKEGLFKAILGYLDDIEKRQTYLG